MCCSTTSELDQPRALRVTAGLEETTESSVAGFDERKPKLVRDTRESIQEESGCVGFCLRVI